MILYYDGKYIGHAKAKEKDLIKAFISYRVPKKKKLKIIKRKDIPNPITDSQSFKMTELQWCDSYISKEPLPMFVHEIDNIEYDINMALDSFFTSLEEIVNRIIPILKLSKDERESIDNGICKLLYTVENKFIIPSESDVDDFIDVIGWLKKQYHTSFTNR